MTELELAKLALDMIAYPCLGGATHEQANDAKYLKDIAQIALVKIFCAKYRKEDQTIFSEIGL